MSDIVPVEQVRKSGMRGIIGIAGGIGVSLVSSILSVSLFGIPVSYVVGGLIGLAGLKMLFNKKPSDKLYGVAAVGVGALSVTLLKGLLWIPAVGLFAYGAWNTWKFIKGMKSRA
jgi:hypothetical protein